MTTPTYVELREALREMVRCFRPFTFRPIGSDGSPARMEQDEQNAAHKAALDLLKAIDGEPKE